MKYKTLFQNLLKEKIDNSHINSNGDVLIPSPFRNEKPPSFCINIKNGLWIDFTTGKKGNAFSLTEAVLGLKNKEVSEFLENAGIKRNG